MPSVLVSLLIITYDVDESGILLIGCDMLINTIVSDIYHSLRMIQSNLMGIIKLDNIYVRLS